MKTKLIITILLLHLQHPAVDAQSKKQYKIIDCEWMRKECDKDPLNVLHYFAYRDIDSLKNYKTEGGQQYVLDYDCMMQMMIHLFRNCGMSSYANYNCYGPPNRTYDTLSVGKSIYTIDLLRLMRCYHSPDSGYVKKHVYGRFKKTEQDKIDSHWKNGNPNFIDTTILGR
jgi:hypothetical protein